MAETEEPPEPKRRRTILGRPHFAGTVGAVVFLWASFWPTLMPRTFVTQGAISGLGAAIGYAVFTLFGWLVGLLLARSLGSYGVEAAFAGSTAANSIANLTARADGALLGSPTNDNEVWGQITAAREDGSPVWRPVYAGCTTVRFANGADELVELDPSWEAPRLTTSHSVTWRDGERSSARSRQPSSPASGSSGCATDPVT